ncbi:MAG: sugar transferase [Balneolaceae bacterium]|nr:MAG: sugar transferase [Balneolaceae bacterium]
MAEKGQKKKLSEKSNQNLTKFIHEKTGLGRGSFTYTNADNGWHINVLDEVTNGYICTTKINSIRRVNKFFEAANEHLQNDQYLVINLETKDQRKKRILKKFPSLVSYPYYSLDFILKRVLPKTKHTRKVYFAITKGKNRVISLTEALGRLVSCGFEIVDYQVIGNLTYIISKKIRKPFFDMQPTYGAIVKLKRVGYKGRIFNVYKVRTMYPYSEYLQDYIFKLNALEEGGKFKNDFRTTSYGLFFRRFWIDELPMLFNWLKREMKLVGVRPLSKQYFYLYPKELQDMRIKTKPGLVPPYYADMPKGLDEILESERKYLESYRKSPISTDIRYFFLAFKNILLSGARSR